MQLVENPPWVNRVLTKHWSDLERRVGPDMMPVRRRPGTIRKGDLRGPGGDFGDEPPCGHYGCVLETSRPGVVCKVTSDASEAKFVDHCIRNGIEFPTGIVEYHAIAILEGESHGKRETVSVLWRQDASQVGGIQQKPSRDPILREEYITATYSLAISYCASALRHTLLKSKRPSHLLSLTSDPLRASKARSYLSDAYDLSTVPDPWSILDNLRSLPQENRVVVAVSLYELLATMMEHENRTSVLLGEAFTHFFEHGIMLADVHYGNLGLIETRGDYPKGHKNWAITDPGHAIFLPVREW